MTLIKRFIFAEFELFLKCGGMNKPMRLNKNLSLKLIENKQFEIVNGGHNAISDEVTFR